MAEQILMPLVDKVPVASTVSIRVGSGDDESSYHAVMGPVIAPMTFVVYCHNSSLLLERVFTQVMVPVEVDFFAAQSYEGELRLHEASIGDACALVVKLYSEKEPSKMVERLCPMT